MLGFSERQKLVKKGLASPKTRRRRSSSEFVQSLETGWPVKVLIFLGFLAGLAALIFYGSQPNPTEKLLIAALILLTAIAQLWINHPNSWAQNSRILLIFSIFLLHLTAVKISFVLAEKASLAQNLHIQHVWQLLLPYALAPLILSVLLGKNQGLFAAVFVSLWGAIVFRGIDSVFLVMSLITGFTAVFVTFQVRRRTRLVRAGVFVGLATFVLAVVFQGRVMTPIIWEQFSGTDWQSIGYESLAAIGGGILTAMIVGGALPVLETLFRVTTDISWLEAADLNHPLLKRMTIEAPGTYHHSLVVANLAEAGAESIGANATMCRVCAYFHDIGKLVKPEYFTENMSHTRNPHDELAPTMSALIIIAHVKEGVDLALKHKLNQQVIDVIQQHHGTSLVFYFHKRALQQQEDARAGGKIMNIRAEDIPEVREESFRYSGPRPQTKESAIISLADCIESASRSLEKVNPQKIGQLINDIIEKRILDGQLAECDLTLRELKTVGESFKFTLQNMMHSRIAYPTDNESARPPTAHQKPASAPPVSAA